MVVLTTRRLGIKQWSHILLAIHYNLTTTTITTTTIIIHCSLLGYWRLDNNTNTCMCVCACVCVCVDIIARSASEHQCLQPQLRIPVPPLRREVSPWYWRWAKLTMLSPIQLCRDEGSIVLPHYCRITISSHLSEHKREWFIKRQTQGRLKTYIKHQMLLF